MNLRRLDLGRPRHLPGLLPALAPAVGAAVLALAMAPAVERGMLGGSPQRNMVSAARDLPDSWDLSTHRNVRWTAGLGSQTYAGPVIAGGRVYVGTNNEHPRDPAVQGDRGVLMAFDALSGNFLWQSAHPKLAAGRAQDWPLEGLCSTPAIEGERLYYLANSAEMVALDVASGKRVWTVDLVRQLGIVPHYMTASSPVVAGDLVFAVTGNGPDTAGKVPAPAAPSFVAVERATGKVRWSDASPGDRLVDGQWGSPAWGTPGGRAQVLFPAGDGWLYSFDPETGKPLWRFDANQPPGAAGLGAVAGQAGAAVGQAGERLHEALVATPVIDGDRVYVALGHDPQKPPSAGRLWALQVAADGPPRAVWSVGGNDFGTSLSTVAVGQGVVYAADFAGRLYAFDAGDGRLLWKYDTFADVWSSPLLADRKVYLGNEDGTLTVFAAGRELKPPAKIDCGSAIYATPAARDGVLYVATRDRLLALGSGGAAPVAPPGVKPVKNPKPE